MFLENEFILRTRESHFGNLSQFESPAHIAKVVEDLQRKNGYPFLHPFWFPISMDNNQHSVM